MFIESRQHEMGGIMDECLSSMEIIGGFASWVRLLKKEEYFSQLCAKYDSGALSAGMMSGYSWGGGLVGGYAQDLGWGSQQGLPMQQHMVSCHFIWKGLWKVVNRQCA